MTFRARSQRSGTPKASVPSGMEADNAPSPCRPRKLSSEYVGGGAKGPAPYLVRAPESSRPETSRSPPIEEGSDGVSAVPVSFCTDTADILTESPSFEILLREQAKEVLSGIEAVLETSPTIALDRKAHLAVGRRGQVPCSHLQAMSGYRAKVVFACGF
eukprot:6208995-Pleurochrysis_carterae.AAC.2